MIISGKEISTKIKDQLKEEVEQMKNKYDRLPNLRLFSREIKQVKYTLEIKKEDVLM